MSSRSSVLSVSPLIVNRRNNNTGTAERPCECLLNVGACLSPITETQLEPLRNAALLISASISENPKPERDPGRAGPGPDRSKYHSGTRWPQSDASAPLIFVILLSCSRGDALGIDARLSRSPRGLGFQAAVEVEVWTDDREFRRWDYLLNKPQTCAPLFMTAKVIAPHAIYHVIGL